MSKQGGVTDIALPVINLNPYRLSRPETRTLEINKLINAFSNSGFCYITGLEGYEPKSLLKWSKWFFNEVPEEDRLEQLATKAFREENPNVYRGYFPVVPGKLSCKNGIDLTLEDFQAPESAKGFPFMETTPKLNLEERQSEVDEFYRVMHKHQKILQKAGDTVFEMIAEAGGADVDYFKPMFNSNPQHTLRTIQYPQRTENIPEAAYLEDGRIISTGAHQDSGFLTLLQTFHFKGLEIYINDEWFAVPPLENAVVVNLGEQMTEMSNGRFKATVHRVMDIQQDRYSVPFFYEPNLDTNLNCKIPESLLPEGSAEAYPLDPTHFSYASFLLFKLPIYAEYRHISDALPAWVKAKYLHGVKPKVCWASKSGVVTDGKPLQLDNNVLAVN